MSRSVRFLVPIMVLMLSGLGMTACTFPPRLYRMDVQQGNTLTPKMISQLKVGMTKEQIRERIGTPMLTHFFDRNRWDYYYYLKPGTGEPTVEKHCSLFFKGNTLIKVETQGY